MCGRHAHKDLHFFARRAGLPGLLDRLARLTGLDSTPRLNAWHGARARWSEFYSLKWESHFFICAGHHNSSLTRVYQERTAKRRGKMMEAEPMELATEPTSPVMETKKKKSLLGRLRKSRKSKSSKNQQSEPQDAPPASLAGEEEVLPAVASAESRNGEVSVSGSSGSDADDANAAAAAAMSNARTEREAELAAKSVARDGNPVITSVNADQFQPSDVRDEDIPSTEVSPTSQELSQVAASSSSSPAKSPDSAKSSRRGRRQMIVLDRAPTAKESAFGGPPKYDWIDIETAAAVKVQAAFRRNKAMAELEAQGMSTAVMRNRHRARGAKGTGRAFHSDDAPGMLACCGVGFLFGDATGEDEKILAAERRKEYKEKKKQMEEDEKQKRKFRYRKKASDHIDEEFEVVDS